MVMSGVHLVTIYLEENNMKEIKIIKPEINKKLHKKSIDDISKMYKMEYLRDELDHIVYSTKKRNFIAMHIHETDEHFSKDTDRYQYHVYLESLRWTKNRNVALDIGAHIGFYTRAMLENFSEVYSFEASEYNYKCLTENCPTSNSFLQPIGQDGDTASIVFEKDNTGNTFLKEGAELVLRSIDSYNIDNVSLIKMDVQGYELNVLKGAEKTIIKNKPTIIVEMILLDSYNQDVYDYLIGIGYKLVSKIGKDSIFISD
jgi:FkbM family methyltransferase